MKNEIRKELKNKRSSMTAEEVFAKSHSACKTFLESEPYKNSHNIMAYMPLGNETHTGELVNRAFCDGKKIILPVTDGASGVITPCYATRDSEFLKGAFSVKEPKVKVVANIRDIEVVIVPGIAFDKTGARLGFGKGCYDMLLGKTDAIKVGFCYEFQLLDFVPREEHDIKMDYIITENGIICCENM